MALTSSALLLRERDALRGVGELDSVQHEREVRCVDLDRARVALWQMKRTGPRTLTSSVSVLTVKRRLSP